MARVHSFLQLTSTSKIKNLNPNIGIMYFVLIGLAFSLGACAHIDTGATSYRKTDRTQIGTNIDEQTKANWATKGLDPKSYRTSFRWKNYPLHQTALIEEMETLSVHLRSAYIKQFFEIFSSMKSLTGESSGEIAIVANIFELSNENDINFSNKEEGRLIFYSDDVKEGQFLNFNNMPMYGPIQYKGGPLVIKMTILELDDTTEQTKGMIEELANEGAQAYAPAAPALKMLNELAQKLMDRSHNDIEFRYFLVLDPKPGSDRLYHTTLEVGNYAFIRADDRKAENIPWEELVFDENEGKLYKREIDDDNVPVDTEYTDETYMIIEINKGTSSKNIDLKQNTFATLLEDIRGEDKKEKTTVEQSNEALLTALTERTQEHNFSWAKEVLSILEDPQNIIPTDNVTKMDRLKSLLGMISSSFQRSGGSPNLDDAGNPLLKKVDINNLGNAPKLSARQVDFILTHLRRNETIKAKITGKNLTALSVMNNDIDSWAECIINGTCSGIN